MRYEFAESKYLREAIRPNDICLDLGANVGYFTMLMAKAASAGKVFAFEPIALNAALLRASVELNSFSNVLISQCAVGDRAGAVSFSQSSDSAYSSIHDTGRKPLECTVTVPVVTLDEYLDGEGIERVDVMKVDVEGAEGMVIAGATRLLVDEQRRPRIVMLELNDQNLRAFGISVNDVVEKMQNFGYEPFVVEGQGKLVQFTRIHHNKDENVFFLHESRCG